MRVALLFTLTFLFFNSGFAEETLSDYYAVAKENCHDIASIRKEMDRINRDILKLLTERTAYVKRAGDIKSRTSKIADDRQRVAEQEKKISDQSLQMELPLEISLPTFHTLVEASIQFQQSYIDQQHKKGVSYG